MNIEDLKDEIRNFFPDLDEDGKVQLKVVWDRFVFASSEWGHAYINLIKEPMVKYGLSEWWADKLKYLIGLVIIPFGLLALFSVG